MSTITEQVQEAVRIYKLNGSVPDKICCPLRKKWAFLGNMYFVAEGIITNGMMHPSAEHAYHFGCLIKIGVGSALDIVKTSNPVDVKKEATKAYKIFGVLPDVERIRIMKHVIEHKFTPGSRMAGRLLTTGDRIIIEGNWWGDNFWGMDVRFPTHACNYLGGLLMERREELRGT